MAAVKNLEWSAQVAPAGQVPAWFSASEYTHIVAACIAQFGPISRASLAALLGLTQGAISKIVSDLLYLEVIAESDAPASSPPAKPTSATPSASSSPTSSQKSVSPKSASPKSAASASRGRPQTGLVLRTDQRYFIGINIRAGGCLAVGTDVLGHPLTEEFTAAWDNQDPQEVTATLAQIISRCAEALPATPAVIGISLGGHVVDDHTVTYAPFLRWTSPVSLAQMLQERLDLPVLLCNDLDGLLAFEQWFGSCVGVERFALVTIGEGVGYALSYYGQNTGDGDRSFGLAGHIPLDPAGPTCSMGHVGCSQCLSNNSIAAQYSALLGHPATFADFTRDFQANHPLALQLLSKTCMRIGVLVALVANFTSPLKVVIGGESAFLAQGDTDALRNGLTWYRHTQASPVPFEVLDTAWSRWARGAATYGISRYLLSGATFLIPQRGPRR